MDANLTSEDSTSVTPLPQELPSMNSSSFISLFNTCIFNADYNVFKGHLENHQMQQSMLDKCLLQGFQILQMIERETSDMSPLLKLLLQHGAKWDGTLLEHQMTPYHVICESTGDHHKLLSAMLQSAGHALINAKDTRQCTAMMCAVHNANLNCIRRLISYGANMNLGVEPFQYPLDHDTPSCPLVGTMQRMLPRSSHSTIIMRGIFDLLLESGVNINITCNEGRTPIMYAAALESNYCFWKLAFENYNISKYEVEQIDNYQRFLWGLLTPLSDSNVQEKSFYRETNKNITKFNGSDALYMAVMKNEKKLIQYLLKLGVSMTNHSMSFDILRDDKKLCKCCASYMLLKTDHDLKLTDPCYIAIKYNQLDVVRLMEENGCQEFQSLVAIRYALRKDNLKVADYLLSNHKYLINQFYIKDSNCEKDSYHTLLTEACSKWSVKAVLLLLKHGANPNKKSCAAKSSTAMHLAIKRGLSMLIIHFIRTGGDINTRSYDPMLSLYGGVLPFEASVLYSNHSAAEMLLVSRCSCGMFSLNIWHKIKKDAINPEIRKLMIDWDVQENRVISLKHLCRMSILNHLCPGAQKKITELPLPPILITYLGIPELDGFMKLTYLFTDIYSETDTDTDSDTDSDLY